MTEQSSAGSVEHIVAQLRHAYAQLQAGAVRDQKQFANGLIAPQIRALESMNGAAQAPNHATLSQALSKGFMTARAYVDYQIIISFEALEDMQAAHSALCTLSSTDRGTP